MPRLPEPRHVLFVERWSGVSGREPQIGLLVEWERREDGWWGLVGHGHAGALMVRWVRGEELQPYGEPVKASASSGRNEASPATP